MANSRSSEKRVRQNERNRALNRARRSALKSELKKFHEAVRENNPQKAAEQLRVATKKLDQTAAKGTLHKRAASRRKSRLAKRLNALKASGTKAG